MLGAIKKNVGRETMRHPLLATIGVAFVLAFPHTTRAQGPSALTGLVGSAEEPTMEGVLVSATKAGSNITITVVTGADGRYSFPAKRLAPGQYSLAVRAVGHELGQPRKVEIGATESMGPTAATADLKLGKTKDLAAHLSNSEWLASIPGTDQEKGHARRARQRVIYTEYDLPREEMAPHDAIVDKDGIVWF